MTKKDAKRKLIETTQKLIETTLEQLDREYLAQRKEECSQLHNALVDAIAEHKASPQNLLYVLRLLEFETLHDEYEKIFGGGKGEETLK